MQTSQAPGARPSSLDPGVTAGGRFLIEAREAARPYGEHYQARDSSDGRIVSLVVLWPELAQHAPQIEEEIGKNAGLVHKNLAQPTMLGWLDQGGQRRPFLVFEYVDGTSLQTMIQQRHQTQKPIAPKTIYNIVAHLCNTLAFVHTSAPHGAITPDAVRVNGAGRVKLLDYGLGPYVDRSAMKAELAPELTSTTPATVRSDIWALGSLLYQLLSGEKPAATYRPIGDALGLHTIDAVLQRALRPNPDSRFVDVMQLKEELAQAFTDVTPGQAASAAAATTTPPAPAPAAGPPPGAAAAAPRPAAPPAPRAAAPLPPQRTPSALPTPAPQKAVASAPPAAKSAHSIEQAMVDENEERFLIQKDNLDFGPFSLREILSQIESGKILGEHTIVDTHTQDKRRVREHARLRQAATAADAMMAEKERQKSDDAERSSTRKKVVTLLGVAVAVIGLGAGGTVFYLSQLKPRIEQKVIEKDPDIKWDVSLKVDPPEKKKTRRPKVGGKPGEFDEVTNLGDASSEGGDETLDPATVQRVMAQNYKVLTGCILEEKRRNPDLKSVEMDFIVRGAGNVSAVKVNGHLTGALPECLHAKMQTVQFPKFNGTKTHASFTMNLR